MNIKTRGKNSTMVVDSPVTILDISQPSPLTNHCTSQHITIKIKNLKHDDILIMCSGSNDLATNKPTSAFQRISNMVAENNHTNIVIVNIPYRYDTLNTKTVNEGIEKINKKLEKLTKKKPPC
jgi:hypothetical protein